MVFESHDRDLVSELCTQALWLAHGTLVAQGSIEEILRRSDEAIRAERVPPGRRFRRGRGGSTGAGRSRMSPARAPLQANSRSLCSSSSRDRSRCRSGWVRAATGQSSGSSSRTRSLAPVAGVYAFVLRGSAPPGAYAGRVESRLMSDGAESIVGRLNAFSIDGDGAVAAAPDGADGWQPREGSWEQLVE